MREIYFTYRATEHGGVTDQLRQFSAWYKLGRSLGYRYIHKRICCNRSSAGVFDFLSINSLWEDRQPQEISTDIIIELPIASSVLKYHYSLGFKGLKWYVKNAVKKAAAKIRSDSVIVEFRLAELGDRAIFRMIENAVTDLPDGINLRENYFANQGQESRKNLFGSADLKVLVHIRQGDATVIPTPWDTWLSVFSTSVAEFPDFNAQLAEDKSWDQMRAMRSLVTYIDPHDYFNVLKVFAELKAKSSYSMLLSSDGYAKTFERIREAESVLNLSPQKLAELNDMERSYEHSKFAEFAKLEGVKLMLGETDENLYYLIHSALISDVIVASTQQLMMVKLLEFFGRDTDPPILIMLHNGRTKLIDIKARLGSKVSKVTYINVADINEMGEQHIKNLLSSSI